MKINKLQRLNTPNASAFNSYRPVGIEDEDIAHGAEGQGFNFRAR